MPLDKVFKGFSNGKGFAGGLSQRERERERERERKRYPFPPLRSAKRNIMMRIILLYSYGRRKRKRN